MKNDRIEIRVPAELKATLTRQAEARGQTLTEYLGEILAVHNDTFVWCPKCKLPVFDRTKVPIIGKARVRCCCGHTWRHNF